MDGNARGTTDRTIGIQVRRQVVRRTVRQEKTSSPTPSLFPDHTIQNTNPRFPPPHLILDPHRMYSSNVLNSNQTPQGLNLLLSISHYYRFYNHRTRLWFNTHEGLFSTVLTSLI